MRLFSIKFAVPAFAVAAVVTGARDALATPGGLINGSFASNGGAGRLTVNTTLAS